MSDSESAAEPASTSAAAVIRRQAVRALLLADESVLLIHMYIPDSGKLIWLTPGGGLEPEEQPETGLYREIAEETGYQARHCLGPIWQRRQQFVLRDQQFDQSEDYYLIRTGKFSADHLANPAGAEKALFRGFRWWHVDDISHASEEIFVPLDLGSLLRRLLDEGVPPQPLQVGL